MDRGHDVTAHVLVDDGVFPNNAACPLLVYHGVFSFDGGGDRAALVEDVFERHGWTDGWRNGVYDFDHYHSTAHEVLGCYRGRARVRFGGPCGVEVELRAGDAVVIPAGVAHKRCDASEDFAVVGAYAHGRDYDMNRGTDGERPGTDRSIAGVPRPDADPLFGETGPLLRRW